MLPLSNVNQQRLGLWYSGNVWIITHHGKGVSTEQWGINEWKEEVPSLEGLNLARRNECSTDGKQKFCWRWIQEVKAQNERVMFPAAVSGSWKWTCWLALCFHVKIAGSCFSSWFMISDTLVHGWLVLSDSVRHYCRKAVYCGWVVVEKAVQFMEASKQKETGLGWLPTFFFQLDLAI